MEFLGMGTGELVLVAIIALIIFGPGRLPEMARQAGKFMASLKRQTAEITTQVKKELDAIEAAEKAAEKAVVAAVSVDSPTDKPVQTQPPMFAGPERQPGVSAGSTIVQNYKPAPVPSEPRTSGED